MTNPDFDRTNLTERDLQIGVWTYNKENIENNVPLPSVSIPQNIYQLDRLWLGFVPSIGKFRKDLKGQPKEWLKILPTLKNIRFLWVSGSISQELFDTICEMDWLEALSLEGSNSIKDLNKIVSLQSLKHLKIGTSSKLENIQGLSALSKLITFQIAGLKLIRDITPITKMKSLKGLYIQGDMWKKQFIESIEGLEGLVNLEYLSLDGTDVTNKDVTPIANLKNLKSLEVGYWWTKEDLIILYNSLPNLKYGSVKEAVETEDYERFLKKVK